MEVERLYSENPTDWEKIADFLVRLLREMDGKTR